mmetsp:Transcript_88354/g.263523  ORF Transcript_88354/g.263523 Transcript_88354/m.263523 type:complete len:141 (-) Transcript_88354:46-468(-)
MVDGPWSLKFAEEKQTTLQDEKSNGGKDNMNMYVREGPDGGRNPPPLGKGFGKEKGKDGKGKYKGDTSGMGKSFANMPCGDANVSTNTSGKGQSFGQPNAADEHAADGLPQRQGFPQRGFPRLPAQHPAADEPPQQHRLP